MYFIWLYLLKNTISYFFMNIYLIYRKNTLYLAAIHKNQNFWNLLIGLWIFWTTRLLQKVFTTLFFLLLYFFLAKKTSSGSNAWMMIKRIFLLYLCPNPEVETLAMKKNKIYKIFFIYYVLLCNNVNIVVYFVLNAKRRV